MNKYCLCFVEELDENSALYRFLIKLEDQQVDIHVFTSCITDNLQPHDILKCVDDLKIESDAIFYFVSDIENLCITCYRVYHQVFDFFVLFDSDENREVQLYELYSRLMCSPIIEEEGIIKPVYSDKKLLENHNIVPIEKCFDVAMKDTNINLNSEKLLKVYKINGIYSIFEPFYDVKYCVIDWYKEINEQIDKSMLEEVELIINYYHDTAIIEQIHEELKKYYFHDANNIKIVYDCMEKLTRMYQSAGKFEKNAMVCYVQYYINEIITDVNCKVMFLSWLADIANCNSSLENMLELTMKDKILTTYNRYYIWNQVKRMRLLNNHLSSSKIGEFSNELYKQVYFEYYEKLKDNIIKIPKEERDTDFILVMSYSFLGERHAPTRTTLERIYTIGKLLNKRVMLINTRETLTSLGLILMNENCVRNLIKEYSDLDSYEYKDYKFAFFQPDVEMPHLNAVMDIMEFVKRSKPYFILNIGGGSIVSDLCSNIVPVLSMSVAFSCLPITMSKLSILGRKVNNNEWPLLLAQGYDEDSIIESRFTFDLIEKHSVLTREDLGLPKDKFLLLVVGIRLDSEITDEFISYMEKTYEVGTHLVFAGLFDQYDDFCKKHKSLREHSSYIGYCNDMLALNSICNLYVNPKRLGGGFSIIEAFHEGRPGITINTGDVSISGGSEFCVENYDEMVAYIRKYIQDEEFYNEMSKKAKLRADLMTDSKSAMEELIQTALSSKYFF